MIVYAYELQKTIPVSQICLSFQESKLKMKTSTASKCDYNEFGKLYLEKCMQKLVLYMVGLIYACSR